MSRYSKPGPLKWINAALLFILNLVNAGSVKLTLKQEQALAADCDVI